MEKRVLILINKTAGVGKAGSYTLDVVTRFAKAGYEPVVFPILPEDDLTSETIIYQYDGRVDAILCSGGDGTLNHVVNAIMRMCNKPILSYIPAGSTNDFAKGLGWILIGFGAIALIFLFLECFFKGELCYRPGAKKRSWICGLYTERDRGASAEYRLQLPYGN